MTNFCPFYFSSVSEALCSITTAISLAQTLIATFYSLMHPLFSNLSTALAQKRQDSKYHCFNMASCIRSTQSPCKVGKKKSCLLSFYQGANFLAGTQPFQTLYWPEPGHLFNPSPFINLGKCLA